MLKLRDLPFGLYEKSICSTLSWEDKFSLIKDAGYDYFEIAIDATPEKLAAWKTGRSNCISGGRVNRWIHLCIPLPLPPTAFTLWAARTLPSGRGHPALQARPRFCRFCGGEDDQYRLL